MRGNLSKIRAEYITGTASLAELARDQKMSTKTVYRAAKDEGWKRLRDEFRRRASDAAVDYKLKVDTSIFQTALDGYMMIARLLADVARDPDGMRRYVSVETEKDGGSVSSRMVERTFERVDMSQVKQAAESLKLAVDGMHKLLRIPSQSERESQRIAAERLQLERDKFEAEKNKDSTDNVTVRMEIPEGFDA